MNGWLDELIFFPGENAEAICESFVRLCAQYKVTLDPLQPSQYSAFEVAQYVFKDLFDPGRAGQAATVWSKEIAIKERIRNYIVNGFPAAKLTKDEWQAKIVAATENERLSHNDKKAILDGLRLYGESEGWIVKTVDKKVDAKTSGVPQFVIAQYAD